MKLSEKWLREWSDPKINHDTLCDQFTMAGLEVEDSYPVGGDFSGVVVGKVQSCLPHPNADKLQVTQIDIGSDIPLTVVCGAQNCRLNLKVACAKVGAILPDKIEIKTVKLRGVTSEGMLCSYAELGIAVENSHGIIELPQDAPLGMDLRNYFGLDDHIIDVNVTPNRADCFSMLGLGREIAAINAVTMAMPDMPIVQQSMDAICPVTLGAAEAAPRFLTRVINNIDNHVSIPVWMQERLRRSGIGSVNSLVDITNYVMLELGQPLHAYDANAIKGNLVVRYAQPEEHIVLLDGKEVTISADTVIIADQEKVLSLAGIFGGQSAAIRTETNTIILEAAYFSPDVIAGKARTYGLHTEASHRFERGVDPNITCTAINRATQLILLICGGNAGPVTEQVEDAFLPVQPKITLDQTRIDSFLGHSIASEQIVALLKRLGCQVQVQGHLYRIEVPSWRFDLKIEEDIIEEIARIYGYNHFPDKNVQVELKLKPHPEQELSLITAKQTLVTLGYQEAITYSFVDPKIQQLLHPDANALSLPNPISTELSAMRLSLWTGLLGALRYNQNRQQIRIRLFESGLRFTPDNNAELNIRQEVVLSGLINGPLYEEHWSLPKRNINFFDLKGDIEALIALTGNQAQFSFRSLVYPALQPGQSAGIYINDDLVGIFGALHPQLQKQLGIKGTTYLFELMWDKIADRRLPEFKEMSRFPSNRRDIALIVSDNVSAEEIIAECKRVGGDNLIGVNLFDVYQGENIAHGQKSLAISLILQDKSRTLEESDIINIVDICVDALQNRFNALLRE